MLKPGKKREKLRKNLTNCLFLAIFDCLFWTTSFANFRTVTLEIEQFCRALILILIANASVGSNHTTNSLLAHNGETSNTQLARYRNIQIYNNDIFDQKIAKKFSAVQMRSFGGPDLARGRTLPTPDVKVLWWKYLFQLSLVWILISN